MDDSFVELCTHIIVRNIRASFQLRRFEQGD